MKRGMKKMAAVSLASVMAVGMLAGCGSTKTAELDGNAVVATVNGTEIPMGVVSLAARQQQAQTEALYISFLGSAANIWNTVADEESGTTYGTQQVATMMEQAKLWYVLKEHAADYGAELTEEDNTAIQAAAKTFMESNSEETLKALAVSEEQVAEYLGLETISARLYYAIRNEAEVNITDEQAEQSSFSYVSISLSGDDLTEEDIQTRRDNAQSILDTMLADPTADMGETAKAVDETYSGLTGTYTKSANAEDSSSYPAEVLEVLRGLAEGAVYEQLVEVDDTLYILRKDKDVDEDATETQRTSLENTARGEHYSEVTQGWLDAATVEVNEDVLKTLVIDDSHNFSFFTPTATPAPEEAAEETAAEAETTEETPAEETTEAETTEEAPAEETAEAETTEAPAEETAAENN